MEKMVLNGGAEIAIGSGSSLSDIRVVSGTMQEMAAAWEKLTDDSLRAVQIVNGDGTAAAEYKNLTLDRETSVRQEDGTILTSFKLREKTELELLRERVGALERGQEVLDGAVSDLGEAVSGLAEEGGLA